DEKEFKVGEGTFLGDVADTMRRLVILGPAGNNALRVLEPFRDVATYEEWEHGKPSRIRVDGKDRELIQALVTYPRQQSAEYLFELDGSFVRRKSMSGFTINRCTEEKARKP
ncbi:MAG TPA: hypothetical protein VJU16_09640, partial [Planctomycetota bacterium]|nr:hypothetical protein [Planctomycetota bacterium]